MHYYELSLSQLGTRLGLQRRSWHPGVGDSLPINIKSNKPVSNMYIVKSMFKHIWPKDNFGFKVRVVVALTLLVSAKVIIF